MCESNLRYEPKDREKSLLFKIVNQHYDGFIESLESQDKYLPQHVKNEFEAFLKCGILAYGFLRTTCEQCQKDVLLGFSCKKRGFCPSCLARRMSETAAYQVDHLLPYTDMRQWVLSLPFPLRYWCASSTSLTNAVHNIIIQCIKRVYLEKAKAMGHSKEDIHSGSISFIQRFGSSLNLNLHFHILFVDGVFLQRKNLQRPQYLPMKIDDEDLMNALKQISHKIIRLLRKQGYIEQVSEETVQGTGLDPYHQDEPTHASSMQASVQSKIAFGQRSGQKVSELGVLIHPGFGYSQENALLQGELCGSLNGFSLHANTRVKKNKRKRLEELLRYMARGSIAMNRISQDAQGNILYELKTPKKNGATHIKLTPLEFLEKLSALVGLPKMHTIRYNGIFARNHHLRSQVILDNKDSKQVNDSPQALEENSSGGKRPYYEWQKLLKRVFGSQLKLCLHCGHDQLKVVAAILCPDVIQKILDHLNLSSTAPPRGTVSSSQKSYELVYEPAW